ncbi:MAG: ATP-binding cassette domain-containing protein [Phycisphaerales bacterium]|nr:ATP-binding cassette domain-containing protein [Phycisphaerales bacterium]
MPLLTVSAIRHTYGTDIILDGATLAVEPGEKIGLVGRNGAGKSTLLRVIEGELSPDSGSVQLQKNARIGYLTQAPSFEPDDTVREAAARAFDQLHRAHGELEMVFEAMATAEGDGLEKLLRQQTELEGRIEALGGYAIDHRIDATLHGLGFVDGQFTQRVDTLSGGQKARLGLARLLLESPDLLLLDEPTNHLDIHGRRWLETFLAEEFRGAVIVVSHDRWLLDRVVSRIVEVELGTVREYPGNYHDFVNLRRERKLQESRVYAKQMDKVRSEEAFIRKYKTGQRAKQARGREARLERFKRDEVGDRPIELDVMNLNLPKPPRAGDVLITGEHLSKQYDDLVLFDDFTVSIRPGDRIGVIGPNGTGKTTLARSLLGDETLDRGTTRSSPRLSVGWFRQTQDHIDPDLTIWQYLLKILSETSGENHAREQDARDLAGAFLFSGDDQEKTMGLLSGGERARTVLAGLVASPMNLLVLDEPSNHLDIPASERLEEALVNYGDDKAGRGGALLLISHDRALLEATCETLIVFHGNGDVRLYNGRYSAWQAEEDARNAEAEAAVRAASSQEKAPRKPRSNEKKKTDKGGSLGKLSIAKLEQRIEEIERRIREIDEQMIDPAVYTDGRKTKALQSERSTLSEELEPLEFEWASRAEDD